MYRSFTLHICNVFFFTEYSKKTKHKFGTIKIYFFVCRKQDTRYTTLNSILLKVCFAYKTDFLFIYCCKVLSKESSLIGEFAPTSQRGAGLIR